MNLEEATTDMASLPSGSNPLSNPTSAIKTSSNQDKFLFDCDHLINFCTQFEQSDIQDQTDSVLEVKLEDLENRWQRLQATYEGLMLAPRSVNTKDYRDNARVNFNASSEAYYMARSQILDILRISGGNARQNARHSLIPAYIPQPSVDHSSQEVAGSYIKVPPCDTEVFKGGYEEWPSFRDMFTAVYVNHPKLTRAQKLYHLRNKTRGAAGAIVKRFTLCDENFELAWSALKARYENKRVLVDNQLKVLFNIPMASVENSEAIHKIQSTVNDCLCTLETLDVNVESWDPILLYLVSTKLPDETLALWEQSLKSHRDLPTWKQLDEFLINRYEIVERLSSIKATKTRSSLPSQSSGKVQTYHSQEKLSSSCPLCSSDHTIRSCGQFRKYTAQQRIDFAYKHKLCINCLSSSHLKTNCKSVNTCIICHKPHHTLLHLRSNPEVETEDQATHSSREDDKGQMKSSGMNSRNTGHNEAPSTSGARRPSHVQANFSSNNEMILLRTALVRMEHQGELFTLRALIDPGSQRTFITQRIQKRLQIPTSKAHFEIFGIGEQTQTSNKECQLVIVAEKYDVRFTVSAIVLPKMTKWLPSVSFKISNPSELEELDLADPNFNKSAQIDLILGNDSERFINMEGIRRNICGDTSAYNTVFGWVLSGPMQTERILSFSTNVVESEDIEISELLRKFWEQEEVPMAPPLCEDDQFCEEFYSKTTSRSPDGKYVVRLPFKAEFSDSLSLGSSRFLALAQYNRMETKLSNDPELKTEYNSVLNEYISLDHAQETSSQEINCDGRYNSFYLPHHAVVRPEHKSTKVRVVFNASRRSKSGYSLNDVLRTGPTLQTDLTSVILNWRRYRYVFGGDIQKMYRQIWLHPIDRAYQRILFRPDPNGPVKDFELKTVTFGLNCAPFLAIRTLLQLASDSEDEFPNVAKTLRKETYVDDILSGGFTIEDTIRKQEDLISVLGQAGFPLVKLTANDPQLLARLPKESLYDSDFLRFDEASTTKTLGIKWNALTDSFSYTLGALPTDQPMSKRKVLSAVAQLFDPAGWVAPIVIRSKILMQQLWLEGLDWDDELGSETLMKWNSLISDLNHIGSISIPRWLQYYPTDTVEIHGCTITPPFHVTGIDFAGPFDLKSSALRRAPLLKGYVSIFVCFSTKAVHLEPCSELSTAAFEAAFSRFVGRRGLPRKVVSDNGRNFVGASRKMLREFRSFIQVAASDIAERYSTQGFEWQFIPPHAPHMGGLWESAVKCFKHHFRRVAGAHLFTFEQFATLLARIEGVLNSRPISAVSEDPNDLTALTPGHFLKGAPIMSFPEPLAGDISVVNRWVKLKAIHHQFAIRWKEEYLRTLQKRYKWKTTSPNVKVGDLVVVMDDLLPPSDWRLGRVSKTYSGSDRNTRIADVKIASGVITRPIVKLCHLPILDQTQ
ncbi:uncharacterized protein LOC131994659 [Stomoxys calcitrans]|uniref:uncharacterized protein LOC131994659 n=2 Tax=Stomoxys calcitrans TaxID=35570 RepID=UPI0027E229E0|nr:uncharacterized protein LOC131994659 [Stomoxys calcitrans]